jgi:hypothetical protein
MKEQTDGFRLRTWQKLCACVRQSCCTQFGNMVEVGNVEIRDDTRAQKALFVRQLDHVGDVGRA